MTLSKSLPFAKGVHNNVVQDFSPAYAADLKVCTTEIHWIPDQVGNDRGRGGNDRKNTRKPRSLSSFGTRISPFDRNDTSLDSRFRGNDNRAGDYSWVFPPTSGQLTAAVFH